MPTQEGIHREPGRPKPDSAKSPLKPPIHAAGARINAATSHEEALSDKPADRQMLKRTEDE